MSAVFVKLLEMSVVASICILAVAVLRLFLKRLPKIFSYVLWLIVLVRLLCPFAFESSRRPPIVVSPIETCFSLIIPKSPDLMYE